MTKTVLKEALVHGDKHVHVFSQEELIISQTCFGVCDLFGLEHPVKYCVRTLTGLLEHFLTLLTFP